MSVPVQNEISVYQQLPIGEDELARLHLLKGINFQSIAALLNAGPVLTLRAGQTLIAPGEPIPVMYLLLSGRLRIHSESLKRPPCRWIDPGGGIGEYALIDRHRADHFVVADQECRLLVLDEDRFLDCINGSHGMARNFLFAMLQHLRTPGRARTTDEQLANKYQRYSNVDQLTGLHNRRWLEDMLGRQIMRSATNKRSLSVLMVDVAAFRDFNETYGANAGDQALYSVAQILLKCSRPTDLIARFQNDQFVVVLPDTDSSGAERLAERIRDSVKQQAIEIPGECILPPVGVHIGMAQLAAFVGASRLLDDAQADLHRAKHTAQTQDDLLPLDSQAVLATFLTPRASN